MIDLQIESSVLRTDADFEFDVSCRIPTTTVDNRLALRVAIERFVVRRPQGFHTENVVDQKLGVVRPESCVHNFVVGVEEVKTLGKAARLFTHQARSQVDPDTAKARLYRDNIRLVTKAANLQQLLDVRQHHFIVYRSEHCNQFIEGSLTFDHFKNWYVR